MNLRYIEIHGFKSFADKTRITFDPGMTAIVGPNGSGKSNISDAVRWVLGEQSSKSLRSGRMEDVIFGGTRQRRAMGFAQVSLGLDNSDRRLPEYGEEVVVSRRYYRSGDSEYLINGSQVRLRDVREAFLDTGLSRDGYSIIGQGRISEIVSAKSADRREIFEEASGIAKYRFRKNEAEKRLEAAEDNLSRLRDILDELGSRLEPLRRQSESAKRFLELSEQRKGLEITLYCDTIDRSRESIRQQEERISIARRDYSDLEVKIAAADRGIEEKFERMRELSARADSLNGEIVSMTGMVTSAESAAAVLENDTQHAQGQIDALRREMEQSGEAGSGIDSRIAELESQREQKLREAQQLQQEIASTEELLRGLALQGEESDRLREDNSRKLSALTAEVADLRSQEVTAASAAAAALQRSEMLGSRQPELQEKLSSAEEAAKGFRQELDGIMQQVTSCENQKSGLSKKLELRRQKLNELEAAFKKKNFEYENTAHRLSVLMDMEKSMEGFSHSVREVIEAGRRGELRGIIGTVASIIGIKPGCETAIETALGNAVQNIVVTDERVAKDAIAHLKQRRSGRATFLPLDTVQPSRFDGGELRGAYGVVGVASELVSYDGRFSTVISNLLGRIVVAEDLQSASGIAKRLRYRNKIVTLDGQVINSGGSFTGGYSAKSAGVFSRKGEIDSLTASYKALREELVGQKSAMDSAAEEVSQLDASLTVVGSELINLGGEKIRLETELHRLDSELEDARQQLGSSSALAEQARRDQQQLEQQAAQARERIAKLESGIKDLESFGLSESANSEEYHQKRLELAERLSEQKIRLTGLLKDADALEASAGDLRTRRQDAAQRGAEIENSIASLEKSIADGRRELSDKRLRAKELRERIEAMRGDISAAMQQRMEVEKQSTAQREEQSSLVRQREETGKEVTRLEERREALEKEFNSAVSRLWEDYELTHSEARGYCVEFDSISALRQQVSALREQIRSLGSVNLSAIEEYKEVGARHSFLSEQVRDVEGSRAELLKLIDGLMGEMKSIFSEKFSLINSRFSSVFKEMFGGGSASLTLTDPADILESGIEIDVQPPGKVIKNLSLLSGGEQALVAIALYFAILSVNPSPFCILDEIDSALDDVNVTRFAQYVRRISEGADGAQFITITHRRGTMEASEVLYGVTMQEEGVSRVLKLERDEAVLVASK